MILIVADNSNAGTNGNADAQGAGQVNNNGAGGASTVTSTGATTDKAAKKQARKDAKCKSTLFTLYCTSIQLWKLQSTFICW
jgi:hypothetical protein